MANTIAVLLRVIKPISNYSAPALLGRRNLYSKASLGIDNFVNHRQNVVNQLKSISATFRTKMNEVTEPDSQSMVFTEDLKNMTYLAESDDDMQLVIKMLRKFNKQNQSIRFGNFIFGPVIMRMFYNLNKPNEALECFKDSNLTSLFDQIITYQILLDLLYENRQYNEIIQAFTLIKEKQIQGIKFVKNVVVLTLAACYKLNTPESLDFALKLWSDLNNIGHKPMRKAVTFCAGLALNQGKPDVCLEILQTSVNTTYVTVRNLKVLALLELGRTEDVIQILKLVMNEDSARAGATHTFSQDVIERVKNWVEKLNSTELKTEFTRILQYLNEEGHVDNNTLDELICQEIVQKDPPNNFNRGYSVQPNNRFRRRMEYSNNIDPRISRNRPGLYDVY